ncbi:MAG: hypothetical protein COA70_13245 [Planctomycetota bacterium]|nr:MAG: hypothetical protein COA70_13245 [Planctomycetota bacterium]
MSSVPFGGAVGKPPKNFRTSLNFEAIDEALAMKGLTGSQVRKTAQRSLGICVRLDRLRQRGRASVEVLYALSVICERPMEQLLKVAC